MLVLIFRDGGQLGTSFGRRFLAAGTVGEVGPIIAMSLLLSQRYTSWQEGGFLLAFPVIVGIAIAVGIRAREGILGAFAAGMTLGQATRGEGGKALREKLETASFGWFYPLFFVGTGIKFNVVALGQDVTTALLVPPFAPVRG